MIIHNLKQGTPEWFAVRLGKFTASEAQAIATAGKGLDTLVFKKVAERLTGKLADEQYTNPDIERGHTLEDDARLSYELETGRLVKVVGFCELNEDVGCSPDGLVGDDGMIEIKSKNDINFVKEMYYDQIDPAHFWQMQMQMYVADRKWNDYTVFNPNFKKPLIIRRVERDETSIAKIKLGLLTGINKRDEIIKSIVKGAYC